MIRCRWLALAAVVGGMVSTSGCAGDGSEGSLPGSGPAPGGAQVPDWVTTARIGGLDVYPDMSDGEVEALLQQRKSQNVSVLEVDTRLSTYLTDEQFDEDVAFLKRLVRRAHQLGMRAVIYYPSLEVLTENGETAASSMYKDHPEWVQIGLNGQPNVFYGSREVWVDPGAESAWMSPNSDYRDYFIRRVKKLAGTGIDGVWLDVPLYLETGAAWAGAEPAGAEAFRQWSLDAGVADGEGLGLPAFSEDVTELFADAVFRLWIKWRHDNILDFLEDVRVNALAVNPDLMIIAEHFPIDNMDITSTGFESVDRRSAKNFIRVWEVDSVSNSQAMKYATIEDFTSKISMFKFAAACERPNPPWSFSYGNEPLDAGLVMAAAVAARNMPFETKTPEMTLSVGDEFRTRWFGFIAEHEDALLRPGRLGHVGIWYSAASRDYQDFTRGGGYGMFITTEPPVEDPDWWASDPVDSPLPKPHLGGWRGAAHALTQMRIPYQVITEPAAEDGRLEEVKLLWLPSAGAMSAESAQLIRDYVSNGGVVLATGEVPGIADELGNPRSASVLADVFGFQGTPADRANAFGAGVAIYRPDVHGPDMYGLVGDLDVAADNMSAVEQLVRIHVPDLIRIDNAPAGVHVELSPANDAHQYLYVVNFSGLQQPLVLAPLDLELQYRAPEGQRVVSAAVATPDQGGQEGEAVVHDQGDGFFRIEVRVDQFALVDVTLEAAPTEETASYAGPAWKSAERERAATSAMQFIRSQMRPGEADEPWRFGVFTNLLENQDPSDIYAHGHNVTAEHMGLMLRASACLKNKDAYLEAYRYVSEGMVSPTYKLINWAIDGSAYAPLAELNDGVDGQWLNANAPLDDLRAIRGLLAGPRQIGLADAARVADNALRGLYWTTVTDRDRDDSVDFPQYLGGLLGFAWDWAETDDAARTPVAVSTGRGALTVDLIPVDYQDLHTIALAARRDRRWQPVLESTTDLLLAAEIESTGLFWNGYEQTGAFTGDFENQGIAQGEHLKVIQVLWTALHLASASQLEDRLLDAPRRTSAGAAAQRSYNFFKGFYTAIGRVPEYLTTAGLDVPNCGAGAPANCLDRDDAVENLIGGEARIYAQLARLALLLGDSSFAAQVIEEKILTDWISDPQHPRYGAIGGSTSNEGDAEAWNVLESVLTLCLESGGE